MFEAKNSKVTKSEFSNLLEQERYCLALKGLTAEQYKNFQNETLDILLEVQNNIEEIQEYIRSNSENGYIPTDNIAHNIYRTFIKSFRRFSSQYILDVCSDLIRNIDDFSDFVDSNYQNTIISKYQYSVIDGKNGIEQIASSINNLREKFTSANFDRQNLLAAMVTEGYDIDREKFLAYQELVSKISNFSDSPIQDPQFLINFYSLYSYIRERHYSITDACDFKSIEAEIKFRIAVSSSIKFDLNLKTELESINEELETYKGLFKRVFKRGKLKKIYSKIKKNLNDYNLICCGLNQDILEALNTALKSQSYYEIRELLYQLVIGIEIIISKEKESIIAQYLNTYSDKRISLKFIPLNFLSATEERKNDMIKEGSLLGLFYQCCKNLTSIKLSDEELVNFIKSDKDTIKEFVSSLIEIIEREESIQQNIKINTEDIAEYYKRIQSGRQLTEQEVIDHTIKQLNLSC